MSIYLQSSNSKTNTEYDCNWTRTHNHLVFKRTLNQLAIWPVLLNGWVLFYELTGCRFESSSSHLNLRFRVCFEQGVPWHSDNYKVWIHSETHTWRDKNIQLILNIQYKNTICHLFHLFLALGEMKLGFYLR